VDERKNNDSNVVKSVSPRLRLQISSLSPVFTVHYYSDQCALSYTQN